MREEHYNEQEEQWKMVKTKCLKIENKTEKGKKKRNEMEEEEAKAEAEG